MTDRRTDGLQTDRQTDRILIAIPSLLYMQRGKNEQRQRQTDNILHMTTQNNYTYTVHHRRYSNIGVSPNYVMNTPLEEVTEIKDLGVCFDSLF